MAFEGGAVYGSPPLEKLSAVELHLPRKLYVFLWESAAADRDEPTSPKQPWLRRLNRGWKPLPQGQHFITDRTAQRAATRFQ